MDADEWTVLCTGPSLLELDTDRYLDGPVVAVNMAPSVAHDYDVWCTSETITNLWALAADQGIDVPAMVQRRVRMWVKNHSSVERWVKSYPEVVVEYSRPMARWPSTKNWRHCSTTVALLMAIERGARRIRMLGCDMRGERLQPYPKELEIEPRRRAAQWEARWKRERNVIAALVAEAGDHGVEIERC